MTGSSHLAVEASGLVKTFGTTRAVDGIDLSIPAGSVYGFLGPNGAGKTNPGKRHFFAISGTARQASKTPCPDPIGFGSAPSGA
jgi:ABC-type branched-subunit amino acid transport system ATPase component